MNRLRLELDFVVQRPKVSLAGWGLVGTALLALAVSAQQAGVKWSANERQARTLAGVRPAVTRSDAIAQAGRPATAETARTKQVRETARSLGAPWADLLMALEAAPANVAVLELDPSATKRSLLLTAEALDAADMLNYLKAMQSDTRLSNVVLVSHQVQLQAPGTPLRFKLRANWGDAP